MIGEPAHRDLNDAHPAGFDAGSNNAHVLEYLRKESLDIFNRIHSIAEDGAFIEQVHKAYPTVPLLRKTSFHRKLLR